MTEPPRDRHGRYLIDGVPHTRATTVAGTLDDRFNIERWQERHVALGLAARPDLLALAGSTPKSDKRALNRICKDAKDAAAAGASANLGTAIHQMTERLDRGEDVPIPSAMAQDIAAYRACLVANDILIDPEFVECICVIEELLEPVAGTADRIVQWQGERYIADIKTGGDLKWSWRAIAVQLALYSRASFIYNPETDEHLPMPQVSQDRGIVLHLPAGQEVCTPYLVDLDAGWEAAQMALAVRRWRKRDDLAVAA